MEVVSLIIPFIALAIISVMADRITLVLEAMMKRIPRLPDQFEWWIAYFIVLAISYIVCSEGHYDLFAYLHLNFNYAWEGYLLTALVLSGGSSFVRSQFNMIESIPGIISGVTTTIKNIVVPKAKTSEQPDQVVQPVVQTDTQVDSSSSEGVDSVVQYDSDRYSDNI